MRCEQRLRYRHLRRVRVRERVLMRHVINTRAALVSKTKTPTEEERIHGQELTPFRVQYLNQAIEQMVHEQLLA